MDKTLAGCLMQTGGRLKHLITFETLDGPSSNKEETSSTGFSFYSSQQCLLQSF